MEYLPFLDLMHFQDVCRVSRRGVSTLLQLWFMTLINHFFGWHGSEAYELLRETSSTVCGSGTTWMVAYPCDWFPADISVVCPKAHSIRFHMLLGHMHCEGLVGSYDDGNPRTTVDMTSYSSAGMRINILDSVDEHIFPTVLNSRSSAQMNIACADGMVVFYPLLTLLGTCVRAPEVDDGELDLPGGMGHTKSRISESGKCGRCCSKADRRVHNLEGALCVGWSVDRRGMERLRQKASVCHYTFRLWGACDNDSCQYNVEGDPWTS